MLNHLRALDLTDDKGFLCGKILADLGVNVIKVERPGGDPSRRIGRFWGNTPDPEKSLYWFAYNSNKKGITLDIETSEGREIFKRLVKTADFIIESFPQACLHAGADAAVGCMMAYYHREMSGEGQHVDVSMQQSAAWFQANAVPTWELNKGILKRAGAFRAGMSKNVGQRQVWRGKGGYGVFQGLGGGGGGKSLRSPVGRV